MSQKFCKYTEKSIGASYRCDKLARKFGYCTRHLKSMAMDSVKATTVVVSPAMYDMEYDIEAGKVAKLVREKQAAYGDSFSKSKEVLKLLYPNGIQPSEYGHLLTIVRVVDKLFRIATQKDAFGESPWKDINGYSLLELVKERREKHDSGPQPDVDADYAGSKRPEFETPAERAGLFD